MRNPIITTLATASAIGAGLLLALTFAFGGLISRHVPAGPAQAETQQRIS